MFDGLRLAKVHLRPLAHVLLGANLAVVTELGAVARFRLLAERLELLVERNEFISPLFTDLGLDVYEFGLMPVNLGFECGELFGDHGIGVVLTVGAVERGVHGLHPVVVGHVDRIELVVVAAGALHGSADEGVHRIFHHVVAVDVAGDTAVELGFRHLGMADEIPRAGRDESCRLNAVACVGIKRVAGDLLAHEQVVRFVAVECADDIVAIRPGVGAELVLVVAVCVTVVDNVEPVARPAFAVARRGEKFFDEFFVGQRIGVAEERVDF